MGFSARVTRKTPLVSGAAGPARHRALPRLYRSFFSGTRFAAIDQIQRIRAPLLVIAGGHDRIVPLDNTRRLYDAAVAPKTLLVLPDADHNDYELLAGDEMVRAIVRFLQPLK